jgi:aminoglycoside phosphotransferase (APT) family kinase protein
MSERLDIDVDRLREWLRFEGVADRDGQVVVRSLSGGQSNPIYDLRIGDRALILRRKPFGTLVKGAHAIEREYRVLAALSPTGFPVPAPICLCNSDEVIGAPFYIMAKVDGREYWHARLPDCGPDQRFRIHIALIRTLAQLHTLDLEPLGLSDFGRGGNYVARQIDRWDAQYRQDSLAGRVIEMEQVADGLRKSLPEVISTTLIHGDFRLDNVLFDRRDKVVAVLDWELSTLGVPTADFAYLMMMHHFPPELFGGLDGERIVGIPSQSEAVDLYIAANPSAQLARIDYYVAFNMWRFAAITHGIKGRLMRGNAASSDAARMVAQLPEIARRAAALMEKL